MEAVLAFRRCPDGNRCPAHTCLTGCGHADSGSRHVLRLAGFIVLGAGARRSPSIWSFPGGGGAFGSWRNQPSIDGRVWRKSAGIRPGTIRPVLPVVGGGGAGDVCGWFGFPTCSTFSVFGVRAGRATSPGRRHIAKISITGQFATSAIVLAQASIVSASGKRLQSCIIRGWLRLQCALEAPRCAVRRTPPVA